ncbi:MAG: HAD hydrolase-like protein [Microthrixaceae bacterium]
MILSSRSRASSVRVSSRCGSAHLCGRDHCRGPATFAGKPYQPAADLVTSRFGHVDYVVGDRDDTDGGFARRLGAAFALVMSGGTSREQIPSDPAPEMVHDDLAAVVDHVLGLAGSRR